ncbi:MAG: hypothetical protein AD742_14930 [Methylibium sp. NZG]|nr:MAG: hypothetical protein AD742_14930 [Methylibium sp. NZG]
MSAALILLLVVVVATPIVMTIRFNRRARKSGLRAIDLGVAFVWVVFLYAFLPLLGILLAQMGVGALQDQRLGNDIPESALVVSVAASHAAFMLAFAWAYLRQRTLPSGGTRLAMQVPTAADVRFILGLVIGIKLAGVLLRAGLDVQASEDYIGSYTALRDQSLWVQQLSGLLTATDFAATVLLITTVIAYRPTLSSIVAVVVVLQIVLAVLGGGSRATAFLCAFAVIAARSLYDRRQRSVAIFAAAGLAAFLLAGLVRAGIDASEGSLSLQLLQSGEFLAVYYNSLDLLDRLGDADLASVRVGMYLVDVLRLIPQQFIGEFKIDPATFYVKTFYPDFSEAGGGLAFGSIAESSVGFGWPEALVRGALLGWLYASIANRCLASRLTVVRAFVYVWFVVMAYQSVRDTTFSTLPRFAFQVVPLLIVLRIAGVLQGTRRTRSIGPQAPAPLLPP